MKNFIARAIALVAGAALFIGAFFISAVVFAVAFTVALVFAGVFLWKTRHMRRQMRQHTRQPFDQRDVIEGTVIRNPPGDDTRRE